MMKNLLLFLILAVSLAACSKEDIAYESQFSKSEKAFNTFKEKNNNSYKFILHIHSWSGFSSETTVYVQNGKVVRRDYVATLGVWENDKWNFTILEEYTETENEINTNVNGPKAVTLDEVYSKAKNELLKVNSKENTIYFETKNEGMISSVGYVPQGCQDDCFRGYQISGIEPLP